MHCAPHAPWHNRRLEEASLTSKAGGGESRKVLGRILGLRRRLTLGWKLTLSYTLVTTGALLVVELVVLGLLLASFVGLGALDESFTRELSKNTALRIKPYLEQNPVDLDGVQATLKESQYGPGMQPPPGSESEPDVTWGGTESVLFALDAERRVLGAVPEKEDLSAGTRLDGKNFPELAPLVAAALEGKDDPGNLNARGRDGKYLSATPVEGRGGEVLGVVVSGAPKTPFAELAGLVLFAGAVGAAVVTLAVATLGTLFGLMTARGLTRRLKALASATGAWSRGDFSVAVEDDSRDEVGQLSRDLNRMADQLHGLVRDRQELSTLEARGRLARDLHDSVKQQVFAASLQLGAARTFNGKDPEAVATHLARADELVRRVQKELNAIIHEMRPVDLEGQGLAGALRAYASGWSRANGITASVVVRGERETPPEIEGTIFRVSQEALANVARHSGANNAKVDLRWQDERLTLTVTDDGRGFTPGEGGDGFGLRSMRDRLASISGSLRIVSTPGEGTSISCVCPLDPKYMSAPVREEERGTV